MREVKMMQAGRFRRWVPVAGLASAGLLVGLVWLLVPGLPLPQTGLPPPPENHPGITLHGLEGPQEVEVAWTAYYIAPIEPSDSGRTLTFEDRQGKKHQVTVTRKSYRDAEMEAVVMGEDRQGRKRFAYRVGPGLWRELPEGSHGMGNRVNPLVAMRHVAADQSLFPYGSMVYVPVAKGVRIGGRKMDGYFWVGDTGGRIRGNHMDLFVGEPENYEAFVQANHPSHHRTRVYRLPRPATGYDPQTEKGLAALMRGAGKLAAEGEGDPERVERALVRWQRGNPFIPAAEYGQATGATTLWFLVQLGHELVLREKQQAGGKE